MELFTIDGTDFTQFITAPSYKVSRQDVYDEWEDGNRKKHKYIVRSQIKGTFTMKFNDPAEFDKFCKAVEEHKVTSGEYSGSVLASFYLVKQNIVSTSYVFIDFDPADTKPFMGTKDFEGFDVTIEEV